MANKKSAPAKTGKPAKSPEKAKRETAPAKPPKPPKKKAKGQLLNREERRKAAWLRKTERRAAERTVTEVGTKASTGLTFAQLEASGLVTRQSKPAGPTFEQTLLEVLKEQAQRFEATTAEATSLPGTSYPADMSVTVRGETLPFTDYEDEEDSLSSAALCEVVAEEIRSLLKKTGPIFNMYRGPSVFAAQLVTEELFEKEPESPLKLQLAEVVLADDPAAGIEDFLEEVYDRIEELQLIAGSFEPKSELEKSARLGLIDEATAARLQRAAAKEAIRLDLSQRLAGLTASASMPVEVDETFATLIAEVAQAAEAQRRERAAFRRTLSQRLRQRKEREGRRFSKSSEESSDEELIRFLLSHRGDLAAVRESLPFHLREQVETLLKDGEWKGPLRRQIAAATKAANQLWAGLKTRLAAGADKPEATVAQNAAAMKGLLGTFAQIGALHGQLAELD